MNLWWPAGLFMLLLLPGAQGCQRAAYHYQPLPAATLPAGATPQLLFMSFNMTTDPAGAHRVEPLLVKTVPGQANPIADEDETGPSYLLISQLDAQNKPCGPARRVPHPLVQDVESPTASGALQRQLVLRPEAEFFVRLARLPQARAVRLEEVGPAAPNPLSVTFPLPN
jgi:hypothetical protein